SVPMIGECLHDRNEPAAPAAFLRRAVRSPGALAADRIPRLHAGPPRSLRGSRADAVGAHPDTAPAAGCRRGGRAGAHPCRALRGRLGPAGARSGLGRLPAGRTPRLAHAARDAGAGRRRPRRSGLRRHRTARLAYIDARARAGRAPTSHLRRFPMSRRDSLVDDFSALLADAEELLRNASSETGEKAQALRQQVEAKLLNARLRLQEIEGDALDRAREATRATDDYVRDHPWQTVGVVAAVAFVAGLLLNRR